jgi:spore maturation protein CgeB
VECWGKGWENGRLAGNEMKQKFVRSRINLNFTSSTNTVNLKRLAKVFLNRRSDSTLHLNTPFEMFKEAKTLYRHQRPQIKGRNFEIPGYGGFLLTEFVDRIDQYYIPDKEIVLFRNFDELVGKISFYLHHEEERESIRLAGQRRTLNDHTYEKRFRQILASMSFQSSH